MKRPSYMEQRGHVLSGNTRIVDTIARTAARLAKPPTRSAERAMHELIERQELATIARVYGDACEACRFHGRAHSVPCLKHTPNPKRKTRAKAIGVVR